MGGAGRVLAAGCGICYPGAWGSSSATGKRCSGPSLPVLREAKALPQAMQQCELVLCPSPPPTEPSGTRASPQRVSPSLQLSCGDLGPPWASKLVALRVKNFTSSLGTSACSFPARSSSSPRCVRAPAPPRHQLFPCQISAGSRSDGITTKQRDFKRVPACFLFSPSSTTQYGRW